MSPGAWVAVGCVRFYRSYLRSFRAGGGLTCRFNPSCSEYAVEAIQTWGLVRGAGMSLRRICRCHPWGGFGDDPVRERVRAEPASQLASAEPVPHRASAEPGTHDGPESLTARSHQPRSMRVRL